MFKTWLDFDAPEVTDRNAGPIEKCRGVESESVRTV